MFNWREKVLERPLAEAVSVAPCELDTAETVAAKPALVAPAATVTDGGNETDESLLARATVKPPLGAAALNVTVHASVPAPVMDDRVQDRAVNEGEELEPTNV
jgi:hypothetical protein